MYIQLDSHNIVNSKHIHSVAIQAEENSFVVEINLGSRTLRVFTETLEQAESMIVHIAKVTEAL